MEQFGAAKRILLGMPDWFLYKEIKTKLESYGFEVIGIPFTDKFRYKSIFERAYNSYRKIFFNDRSYKAYLKFRDTGDSIVKILNGLNGKVDYALIIRADYYPHHIISKIRGKSHTLVGYQWDGLSRFPQVRALIPLFDRFFVFNPEDLSYARTLPTTNFVLGSLPKDKCLEEIDVYYLGNYVKERIDKIELLSDHLQQLGSYNLIQVFSNKRRIQKKYINSSIDVIDNTVSYYDNLKNVARARVLIDIIHNVHQGLSFRVFEALGNDKKLITDNVDIKKYEFYDPQNIYVISNDNFKGIKEFLETPYKPLAAKIKNKYTFENWIKYVLNIHPFDPISLPIN